MSVRCMTFDCEFCSRKDNSCNLNYVLCDDLKEEMNYNICCNKKNCEFNYYGFCDRDRVFLDDDKICCSYKRRILSNV